MTRSGRLISPTSIRDLTPLEQLKSTIGTWYQTTPSPPSLSSLSPSSKSRSLPPITSSNPLGESSENTNENVELKWGNNQGSSSNEFSSGLAEGLDELVALDGIANQVDKSGKEKVLWSKWDELVDVTGVTNRRILILGYQEGLALWDCTSLDSWFELLNLPTLNTSLGKELSCRFPLGIGNVISASILPTPTISTTKDLFENSRPLLAIITSSFESSNSTSSNLLLYSLSNHTIIHSQSLPKSATTYHMKVNKNFIVISTTSTRSISTGSLHFYDSKTFQESKFSPLLDLATSSGGEVIFDLGKGGRILSYNCTRPLPSRSTSSSSSTSAYSSPSALNGILSLKGMFDPPHLHYSSTTANLTSEATHLLGEATLITSDAARRMGEGVINGVKKISVLGRDWLNGVNIISSPGVGGEEEEEEIKLGLAKSLPLPKNGFGERRRASVGSPSFSSLSNSVSTPRRNESSSNSTIVILDLLSLVPSSRPSNQQTRNSSSPIPLTPKVLAHFKPYNIPLESLSLSPSSSLLFTASSTGHSFDIFELKPQVQIGRSATSSQGIEYESLWHRYRLIRGFTAALVEKVTWSDDEKFLAVGTRGKGTSHIYAINRTGGKPDLETHFASKVVNSQELSPLSVTLSSITRIRSSSIAPTSPDISGPSPSSSILLPPSIIFLPKQTSLSTSLPYLSLPPPPTSPSSKRSTNLPWTSISPQSQHNYPPPESQFQDLLFYQPHLHKSTLHRLTTILRPTSTVGQVTQGDMGRLARGVGASLLKGSGVIDASKIEGEEEKWEVGCKGKVGWNLNLSGGDAGGEEVREILEYGEKKGTERKRNGGRFGAQVEIETFSRSTHVLPKSIYQSQQFDFYSLPSNHHAITSTGSSAIPLKKIEVRSEVQIRPGSGANDSNSINNGSLESPKEFGPASFEIPIMCAIQSKLDQDEARLRGGKEGIYNPTFPNGLAGRQRHWRETLPITVVGVNVNEGLGRMRRELGRVAFSATNMSMGRRRRTSLSTNTNANYSSSISFEEDDAVWTERVNEENSESGSTGCTSERDEREDGGDAEGEEDLTGDDICWDLEEVNGLELHATPEIPFEDDDDFLGEKQVLISPPTITSVDQDNSSSSFEPSSLEQDHLLAVGRPKTRKKTSSRKKSLLSSDSPKVPLCDLD